MKTLLFLLEKEFRQIFRNPSIIRIIFVMPIIQLVLLPFAANYEVRNLTIAVLDHDHSPYSQQLIAKLTASGYFQLAGYEASFPQALHLVEDDRTDLVLEIPSAFEKKLVKENQATLFIAINAINGVRANLGNAYLHTIIRDFNQHVQVRWLPPTRLGTAPIIEPVPTYWFNPKMDYKLFMVPGILGVLITMIGVFLSCMNIVKEKEIGTIEQINVTPIRKQYFILGKLMPFWLLGLGVLTIGLLLANLVYGIAPVGNVLLLYLFAAVYLLAVLGLGLLISTYADTQQQAMLIAFFLLMVFILLGGLYTPIESMPPWAQLLARFNPAAYFIEVNRMVVLKGSGFLDILPKLLRIAAFAVVFNGWAILNYRKR